MATTVTVSETRGARDGKAIITYYGVGGSNDDSTLTTTAVPKHKTQRLLWASCVYNGAVTQAGVTFTIDSGLGSGYDTLLTTGSANVVTTVYAPDGDVVLQPGDALAVVALAGGVGDIASIQVVMEQN